MGGLDWQDRLEFKAETEDSGAVLDDEVLVEVLNEKWLIVDEGTVHIVLADFGVPGEYEIGDDDEDAHEEHHEDGNSILLLQQETWKCNTDLSRNDKLEICHEYLH